jgi:hypothetical protein
MKKTFLRLILLLIFLLTACASATTGADNIDGPKTPQALQPTAVSTALFQIVKADGTSFGVTLDALKKLPLAQVQAEDGKMEEGPYLSDILALAGITQFTEVTLTGSSNPVTLTFEQVDKNTILDFNNHGTMKLSSTYVPKAKWTKDVSEIVVK